MQTYRDDRPNRTFIVGAVTALAGLLYVLPAIAVLPPSLDDQPVGYPAPVEFGNYNLDSGTSVMFRGDYVRATWDGDLVAYDMTKTGAAGVKWRARTRVGAASWDSGRNIFTSNSAGGGVVFRWSGAGALSPAQQTEVLGGVIPPTDGASLISYLRGDSTNELTDANPAGKYRYRFSKIGAIVHARPYYYMHGSGASAVQRVYVGANDGMLHAFDAATGDEKFAYVPSMLLPKLRHTAEPLPTSYKYYVDGQLAIAPVPLSGGGSMTLLVGGLGAGAKGIYALDVTNPSPATEAAAARMAASQYEVW